MQFQIYCLAALCLVGLVVASDEVQELYGEVFAVSGTPYEPTKTLELLKELRSKAGSNQHLSKTVGTLIEVSEVSDKKCGFFQRKALYNLVNNNMQFVHVAAYLQHYKDLQEEECKDVGERESNPFV